MNSERNRLLEIRENNKRNGRRPGTMYSIEDHMYKTYRAAQLWTALIIGSLGGIIITLIIVL